MRMVKYVLAFLLITIIHLSAQITSTTTGGNWSQAGTWVGGVVPGENSNVVINGPVEAIGTTVNNLTINSGGSLFDECCAGRSVYVKGNLTNHGTIRNAHGGLWIYVAGNVYNYGTMTQSGLRFNGNTDQILLSTKTISVYETSKNPDGQIIANSTLVFDSTCRIWLDNDILNMGTYKLTKLPSWTVDNWFTGGVIYSNGDIDLSGISVLHSNLDGNFTLVGSQVLEVGTITVLHNMRVGPGKIVQDECCAGRSITIKGDLINEGIFRNGYGGLTLYVEGNVINNSRLENQNLVFSGNHPQYISGTKKFSPAYIWKDPNGQIIAASNIVVDSLTRTYLDYDTLNMGSFKLTKYPSWATDNWFSGGVIYSNGDIDVSGVNVMHSNLDGNFTLVGNNIMQVGSITVLHDMRVGPGKIVQDECCAGRSITIKGNLINDGLLKNGYGGLTLYVEGNVINNSRIENQNLVFSGSKPQTMSGTNKFSPFYLWKDPSGQLFAGSDLVIDSVSRVSLDYDTLFMGSYKLTKMPAWNTDNWFSGGLIHSNGQLDISGTSVMHSSIGGNCALVGNQRMECGSISFNGNVTVAPEKLITDECCAGRQIIVNGNLYNYGKIQNRFGGLSMPVYGNLFNYNDMSINWIQLYSEGQNRYISGRFNSTVYLEQSGTFNSEAFIINENFTSNVNCDIRNAKTMLHIPYSTTFWSNGMFYNNGTLKNEGTFYSRNRTAYNSEYDFAHGAFLKVKYLDKAADSTFLTCVTNSAHPKMNSSVKRWWRLETNGKVSGYSLALYYDDNLMNGNDENSLELFVSPDSGKTWKRLSTPINTTRDLANNILYVGTDAFQITDGIGDLILSSSQLVKFPSISSSISGRKQIRVGPPNRYTVTYWNNGNEPTDKFFILLNTNQGVHIESVFSKDILTGQTVEQPADSLFYDSNHDEVFLLIQGLQPREVRSFDVILTAEPGVLNKAAIEPITFTAVCLWIGGAVLEEYISNTIVEGCYEMWRPVQHDESLKDASVKAVKNSMSRAVNVENAGKGIAKKAAQEVLEKTGRVVVWPVMLAKDILDCLGNTVKGMKDYVNGNFDKKGIDLTKVTSWDPNAKEGPAGYGESGFMATAAPMNYTIFFENKKEAQAPAWKIVIVDTLDPNVYDISSVEFGAMSHSMGTKTQSGNILTWEFVNIELPPNVTPPEGEGWVKFTIKPKTGLPTGTQISNRAVIKFDLNPWLATNTFINTLDFDKPETTPLEVVKVQGKHEVQLSWNPADGGSGIKNTQIFMANNEGPYTLAAVSDSTSARIPVEPNILYKFYMLSTDNVGNTEDEPKQILEIMTAVGDDKAEIPEVFELNQNYPNPFNPVTTFSFGLPEKGRVELSIFNILGQRITTIMDQELSPGRYNIQWDAAGNASGIYIYRLTYKDQQYLRKMMLLK